MSYIYPYKSGSQSARALKAYMNIKAIKREGSKFKGSEKKVVINWGNSQLPEEVMKCNVINNPENVSICSNKKAFFEHIQQWNADDKDGRFACRIPMSTNDRRVAENWIARGHEVVCRTRLEAHSGEGIVLASTPEDLVDAPLYTMYVKKKQEYRVHIIDSSVVMVQRKARQFGVPNEDVNWKIRNHAGGFIFAHNEDHIPPDDVIDQASNCMKAVGLDFGAMDVIYNESQGKAYVLEVNTAPGLAGETVNVYCNHLSDLVYRKSVGQEDAKIQIENEYEMAMFGRAAQRLNNRNFYDIP